MPEHEVLRREVGFCGAGPPRPSRAGTTLAGAKEIVQLLSRLKAGTSGYAIKRK